MTKTEKYQIIGFGYSMIVVVIVYAFGISNLNKRLDKLEAQLCQPPTLTVESAATK